MAAYRREADVLEEYYDGRGTLAPMDADRPVEEIAGHILETLDHRKQAS